MRPHVHVKEEGQVTMSHQAHSPTRRRRRLTTMVVGSTATALLLAACGGSSSGGSTPEPSSGSSSSSSEVSAEDLQATVNAALQTDTITADSLPPLMKEALERATVPLTQAQKDKAIACWKATSCQLGDGDVTVAEADGFGDNTWRKFSKMDVILQAITYPEVGKFIYMNAHGDLAQYQSGIRSLTAQGAKVIVAYNDFGPAAWPAFAAAQRSGAYVSTFVGGSDGATTAQITTRVQPDLCDVGKVMAKATQDAVGNEPVAYFTGTPGNPQDSAWQKCATEAGVNSIFNGDTSWTPAGAAKAAAALIASGKPAKAILYSYSNPVPNIVKAYDKAGKDVPAIVTWTTDNGTLCQLKENPYTLYLTNALNWAARVSVTAMMKKVAGEDVDDAVIYPMPFVKADPANCKDGAPADYPGASALVPDDLVTQRLGG
jgi:ABC-type sugar transport system substrate-binding protein